MTIPANKSGRNLRFEPHHNVAADKLCATTEPLHDTPIAHRVAFLTYISDDPNAKRPRMLEPAPTDEEATEDYVAKNVLRLPNARQLPSSERRVITHLPESPHMATAHIRITADIRDAQR